MAEEQGHLRILMDGEWDLDDLRSLTSTIRLSYAYFFWVHQDPVFVDSVVRAGIQKYFWSGEYIGDRFAQTLYDHIPGKSHLRLVSIHFASPGWLELAGYLPVIAALGWVTRIWIKNFDQAIEIFKKVDGYFSERKLRDLRRTGSIDDIDGRFIDEARALCFEYGRYLGLLDERIDGIISLTGNPISALRLLTAPACWYEQRGEASLSAPGARQDQAA